MKTIELTQEQKNEILNHLIDVNGEFDIDVFVSDDIRINLTGYVYTDGYYEDDYFSGTGAYVETSRTADVVVNAYVGEDEEWRDVGSEFDRECYDAIQAA